MNSKRTKAKGIWGVILAAGEGKRMRSKHPKVLHPLAGKAMVEYVVEACQSLSLPKLFMVVGHQGERVREALSHWDLHFVFQPEQRGSGHALMQLAPHLQGFSGDLLVLCGDIPLISPSLLQQVLDSHRRSQAAATVLATTLEDPTGYGRIVRDERGDLRAIVEEADATSQERAIREVNAGIYCFSVPTLLPALGQLGSSNRQGEYYLPGVFARMRREGHRVEVVSTLEKERVLGINSRVELARALEFLRRNKREEVMREGVTLLDPESTFIDASVQIGKDTVVYPHCYLEGPTVIGEDCTIYPGAHIVASRIGNGVIIFDHCLIRESEVGDGARVGPFAHLRPQSQVGREARIGNFVEIKKSEVGEGSKVPHLSYVGDSSLGRKVNLGAGSITCNYDGFEKHRTRIGDEAFVGSNTIFIAPVSVGEGAIVAAGSVVTEDVPPQALAIARARQINKEGWASRWREKKARAMRSSPEKEK